MYKVVSTEYTLKADRLPRGKVFAVLGDLHSREDTQIDGIVKLLEKRRPDFVLAVGDIFERLDGSCPEQKGAGFALLGECAKIAPTLYSIGNHENGGLHSWNKLKWKRIGSLPKYYDEAEISKIRECGVHILDDEFVLLDGIVFGGLTSGLINEGRAPHTEWLDAFEKCSEPRVLLCHHPEYYKKYLKGRDIDLVASGHAHGGQWRLFGRGVYSPGQGIFPKYTSGVHDGRFVVTKGLKRSGTVPRIFNTPEVVFITIK